MRFTLDSNVLVYAVVDDDPAKGEVARNLILRALDADAVLTAQAIAEFMNVVRRKDQTLFGAALEQAERWAAIFPIAGTTWTIASKAAEFAGRHRLQLWDCVIWQAARSMGASVLLSEDFQDGLSLEGMTVINPFSARNQQRVDLLLRQSMRSNDG